MNRRPVWKVNSRFAQVVVLCLALLAPAIQATAQTQASAAERNDYLFNDSHFHLTNYIQEGINIRDFLKLMGNKAGRVLEAFPGVFSGIGEFSIHKEFVSSKISGEVASLQDPALDRLLDFAAEVGLVVLIHNDIDTPFAKEGAPPAYFEQIKAVFKRHPKTTFIWAHIGVGRIIRPVKAQGALIEQLLTDPAFNHVNFDISWSEVAKYAVATPESTKAVADVINRYPDRFLFGTDEVAPPDQEAYLRVYNQYAPLWKLLDKETSEKVRKGNYARVFDEARRRVRAWEQAHVK
jgi:hypothetical protein